MPSFFRLAKNKQFNYLPRYYNEQKEEMKKRKERIAKEIVAEEGRSEEGRIPIMKGQIRSHYRQTATKSKRMSSIRLLAILAALLFLAYYLLLR